MLALLISVLLFERIYSLGTVYFSSLSLFDAEEVALLSCPFPSQLGIERALTGTTILAFIDPRSDLFSKKCLDFPESLSLNW